MQLAITYYVRARSQPAYYKSSVSARDIQFIINTVFKDENKILVNQGSTADQRHTKQAPSFQPTLTAFNPDLDSEKQAVTATPPSIYIGDHDLGDCRNHKESGKKQMAEESTAIWIEYLYSHFGLVEVLN